MKVKQRGKQSRYEEPTKEKTELRRKKKKEENDKWTQ